MYEYEIVEEHKHFDAWCLGEDDEPVKVKVVGSDFDKYLHCEVDGEKRDYFTKWYSCFKTKEHLLTYKESVLTGTDDYHHTSVNPWKDLLSNKNYARYKKEQRKCKTGNLLEPQQKWIVEWRKDTLSDWKTKEFKFMNKAFNFFKSIDNNKYCRAILFDLKFNARIEYEHYGKDVYIYDTRGYQPFKSRRIGKTETYKEWRK